VRQHSSNAAFNHCKRSPSTATTSNRQGGTRDNFDNQVCAA
jgi:hypothetical protein